MIHSVLIFNNSGKPRLSKFYSPSSPSIRAAILERIYSLVSVRGDTLCNFVELPSASAFGQSHDGQEGEEPADLRVIYRHYATLYFVFVVDQSESELGILDLIQVFVESLDRCFENVCELDLIFHFDQVRPQPTRMMEFRFAQTDPHSRTRQVHALLSCIITGGLVLDTSIDSIQASFSAQMKARKASQSGNGISSVGSGLLSSGVQEGWDRLGLGGFGRGR
ncbi:BQ2448_818 [Microbotryum intermedium]|uniref:AP complex subunit sigma n=1 Tax=Microbotryum intermedium TaxID=269621 RepID=A0A238F6E5_9BASI|nr:BQ2448_818 [Microbotryum intermedium]